MSALMRLGGLIRPFDPAEGAPPQQLGAFFRWCLSGAWPMLLVAAAISSVAGATEVVSALILGWVIDAAVDSGPTRFFIIYNVWYLPLTIVRVICPIRPSHRDILLITMNQNDIIYRHPVQFMQR